MKKMIAMVVAVAVCATVLAGCGINKSNKNIGELTANTEIGDTGGLQLPIANKNNITVSMLVESDFSDRTNSFAFKELSRRTGVAVKVIEVPAANLSEKAKVLISSSQLPDIMPGVSMNFREINNLGMQGGFAAVNKYTDILPNFKRIFVDNPENNWIFKSSSAGDGNLYYWPKYEVQRPVNHGFLYRKDVFDKNGIKPWANTEEFYQALKRLKEIYPESIPFVSKTKSKIFADFAISWGLNGDTVYYNENEKVWKPIFTDTGYKQMLDLLKKMYQEKLLDPEFISDTQASWTSKMTQAEKAFVTCDWIGRLDMFAEQVKGSVDGYDLRYAKPVGPKGTVVQFPKIEATGYGLLIANNKNTETALKLVDYLTSDSGMELMTMGVKDVTYKQDENNKITYPEFAPDKKIGIMDLAEKYGMFIEGAYTRMDKRSVYFNYSEKEKEAQDLIINNNLFEPIDPILSFAAEELDIIKEYEVKLKTARDQFCTKYVVDPQYGDEQWAQWNNEVQSLGMNKLVEVYNNAQKRYNGK